MHKYTRISLTKLKKKIVEIEDKIVDVFLREYEEQSIHDFLKEKIIEKVIID